jgi:hypothetical protein
VRVGLRTAVPLLASLATAAWLAAAPGPQGTDDPPVWPLGPDGSIARVLYSTHGQYVDVGYGAFAHEGIDIAAAPNEPVYAIAAGLVVYSSVGDSDAKSLYQELIVSSGEDLSRGVRYLHLATSEVQVGDVVEQDQLLGTVVDWEDVYSEEPSCCYDHLHLQVVSYGSEAREWSGAYVEDGGNPLSLLDLSADIEPPWLVPSTLDDGTTADVLVVDDQSWKVLDPGGRTPDAWDDLQAGRAVDIVAAFHDLSGGEDPPVGAGDGCSCSASRELAPHHFELRITPLDDAGDALAPGGTELPSLSLEGPIRSPSGMATDSYFEGSAGTYTERELRFVLTHDAGSRSGAWTPPSAGKYRIEITVSDAAGNTLTVPPVDVTVESP